MNKINKLNKAKYYSKCFEENKKKLNNVWQLNKEIININKKNSLKKYKTSTIKGNL